MIPVVQLMVKIKVRVDEKKKKVIKELHEKLYLLYMRHNVGTNITFPKLA